MGNLYSSAYSGEKITVDQLMQDPTYIPQRQVNAMTGLFVEELIFRKAQDNKGTVAFNEAIAPYMADDVENVPEFGEIPVSNPKLGKFHAIAPVKAGQAWRVSLEMRTENKVDAFNRGAAAQRNSMTLKGAKDALTVLEAANIPTIAAATAWDAASDPEKDIFDALEMVQSAHNDGNPDALFDYVPDTILMHPATYSKLMRHKSIREAFTGAAALENPVFKGLIDRELFGLRVARSYRVPLDSVYVFEAGAAGFWSDTMPLQATPFYSELGESESGGATQSWRSDMFRKRALAVDNPKAIVKIGGVS